jgi:hypothetical protein
MSCPSTVQTRLSGIVPSDFILIGPLQKHFEGKHFQHNDDVKVEMQWDLVAVSVKFRSI